MGKRGRKSRASMSVVRPDTTELIDRPKPPSDLIDEQADEWRAIVDRLPADWFPHETFPLLAQYCRHITRARRLAQLIENNEREPTVNVKYYRDLLRSEVEQSRIIESLATKMRLSQQTTYDKSKRKPVMGKPPWEC